MAGRLEQGGRVAAAALLALGSLAPVGGPFLATSVAPVADATAACPVTVGTATTDATLSVDAARAIAVGYVTTDCLPDAALLAAAEARAVILMPTPTTSTMAVATPLGGTTSSGSVAPATTTTPVPTTAVPTTAVPTTAVPTTTVPTTVPTTLPSTSTPTTPETTSITTTPTTTTPSTTSDTGYGGAVLVPDDEPGSTGNTGNTGGTGDDDDADGEPVTGGAGVVENFDGDLQNWGVYDGPGHAGNGRRSPSAMNVSDGVLTITGDENGTTGGMAWRQGRAQYGRWEARVRAPLADPSYNALALLWPDAEDFPAGGEIDFMEITDETRRQVEFFLHYGSDNSQDHGSVEIDATQWHTWAVEWTPTAIVGYVDGQEWYRTTDTSHFPPRPMHLTLQLDWFPRGDGSLQQSTMQVDWVRFTPLGGAAPDMDDSTGATLGTTTSTVEDDDSGGEDEDEDEDD